ncbi:MAG TPA: hypothetical protein VGM80_01750 [Gaiellaceae bacterium]
MDDHAEQHDHDGHDHAAHDHSGHDHGGHDHSGHDHAEHGHGEADDLPDASGWIANTERLTCPACGAAGAVSLGGGTFCPTCGEVTTSAGFQAPAPPPPAGPEPTGD